MVEVTEELVVLASHRLRAAVRSKGSWSAGCREFMATVGYEDVHFSSESEEIESANANKLNDADEVDSSGSKIDLEKSNKRKAEEMTLIDAAAPRHKKSAPSGAMECTTSPVSDRCDRTLVEGQDMQDAKGKESKIDENEARDVKGTLVQLKISEPIGAISKNRDG